MMFDLRREIYGGEYEADVFGVSDVVRGFMPVDYVLLCLSVLVQDRDERGFY